MRFGNFMAPFHPVGQNPTLAIERDLELIVAMDRLGFAEAWIGEHHSAGFEIISSPEVFIGVAAERTKHIKLGTGVSSLPYHHPLMLADRMVLLDHLTRGRVMLGCGPGQLTSDAHMLGIPADAQRPRMEQSLDAITRLLRGETVTMHTDGFTCEDARLQLRPYTEPCFDIAVAASFSPTGPRGAGKHGVGMLSIAATARQGMDLLAQHWKTWEDTALEHGHVADRSKWRLVGPMHLAETREQAERDVEHGIVEFSQYFKHLLPAGPVQGDTVAEILANNRQSGFAVIGTPEDAVAKIDELVEASDGGFGAFLLFDHDWAPPAEKLKSYELFAQYVMPRFTGQLAAPAASRDWVLASGTEFMDRAAHAIGKAISDHEAERSAKQA
ncbi:LLM class flavin-dependent oxidoreductase [Mycobacterium yunnanensis]|uniref:LLM class flavin-dependent oxidoreductase n=1 Tax=Mycobacterium yunnanensis TaxID=368477 RepID=A0A9X2YSI3_9MYCO|nr:LLM class flavin-dependent oxidoreductase [Mycobacterium yunnanensis]MCV7424693.1 LLM class flavin-dependent oxidoreductase [Mycobacterium yunnanensis]